MNCDDCIDNLSAFLDGEIPELVTSIDTHLATCEHCRSEFEAFRQIDQRLNSLKRSPHAHQNLLDHLTANTETAKQVDPIFRMRLIACVISAIAASVLMGLFVLKKRSPDSDSTASVFPTRSPIARLVSTTGQVELQRSNQGNWNVLESDSALLYKGDRLRTLSNVACQVTTNDRADLRLNQETEIRLLERDTVECVSGQLWCKTDDRTLELVVPNQIVGTNANKSTQGLSPDAVSSFTCPTSTELMWTVKEDKASCLSISPGAVELKSNRFSCTVPSGESIVILENGKRFVEDPNRDSPVVADLIWQIPLLSNHPKADAELARLIEGALAMIGRTKIMSLTETNIRQLGEPGACALLAYVESKQSESSPESRHKAMLIAIDLAGSQCGDRLRNLSQDPDPIIASLPNQH